MEFDTSPINRCSKRNEKIYQEWFSSADSDGDGRLIGKDATSFLAMSNLPREDLKQFYELLLMYRFTFSVFPKVWAIADSKRQGYLGFKEFITEMQLVSLAQAGRAVTSNFSNAEGRSPSASNSAYTSPSGAEPSTSQRPVPRDPEFTPAIDLMLFHLSPRPSKVA
ncbi:EH domain-containing protein 1 [Capsicum baccatum]|uniref:EH domain-containing protein 1 n=1 Tax=Capsicum baccatum TaxID=33114 RepID=A0A2G2UXQ7_CAPBA|nr:EH domain-containing protein 1 [Capsicum baccatum]